MEHCDDNDNHLANESHIQLAHRVLQHCASAQWLLIDRGVSLVFGSRDVMKKTDVTSGQIAPTVVHLVQRVAFSRLNHVQRVFFARQRWRERTSADTAAPNNYRELSRVPRRVEENAAQENVHASRGFRWT